MKKRMQITVSEEIKQKMNLSKDFYGGYSALIEKAVEEFLSRPVEPFAEDLQDSDRAKRENEWVDIESIKKTILRS